MSKKHDQFDFWYAVSNTQVVVMPQRRLETFGNTLLNYHMLSELMDSTTQVRVREGRIQAFRPQIMTPSMLQNTLLEGFGQEAEAYIDWLKQNPRDMHALQYGFTIKKQEISEHIVTANLQTVLEQVRQRVATQNDSLSAILVGVDSPWEVCLLKLMVDVIRQSAPGNLRELKRSHLLDPDGGVPRATRMEIEKDFVAASGNPALIKPLGKKLQQCGLFEEYEDRFYALLKSRGPE